MAMEIDGISEKQPDEIDRLVRFLDEELKSVAQTTSNWSIFKIPHRLRQVKSEAYTPQTISIGPFHHGHTRLSSMEDLKRRYILSLLSRTEDVSRAMRSCVAKTVEIEAEARACYAGDFGQTLDRYDLAKILVTDGCFIIELFLRYNWKKRLISSAPIRVRVEDDPIFKSDWMVSALRRDLALLENQIPLFVLQELFNTLLTLGLGLGLGYSLENLPNDLLAGMAFRFFEPALHSMRHHLQLLEPRTLFRKHLLNLLLNVHLPPAADASLRPTERGSGGGLIYNVTTLRDVGIEVTRGKGEDLFSFRFDNSKGVLEIPPLHIHECSDSMFRNLMAFEHCFFHGGDDGGPGQCIASYLLLMDRLVNTKEDVKLLEQKRIITNELGGSGEFLVDFFKGICEQVVVKEFYFEELCQQVERYYKSRWRRHLHDLKWEYFASPWKAISLNVAAVILSLATLQTLFSILSYYPHKQ